MLRINVTFKSSEKVSAEFYLNTTNNNS